MIVHCAVLGIVSNTTPSHDGRKRLAERHGEEDLFVLDVRREDEYKKCRIEGSHNLSIYDQLLTGMNWLKHRNSNASRTNVVN